MDFYIPQVGFRTQAERNSFNELEGKIATLVDNAQRDDVKLKVLHDIWNTIENHFTNTTHEKIVEKIILSFLSIFCNTSPQFIAENNTQQLRKLMLEIILRLSNVECLKVHSKDIIKQMMRLIAVENEENACLAIKIVSDQGRSTGKMVYTTEVTGLMTSFKQMVVDLTASGRTVEMFMNRDHKPPSPGSTDEQLIREYLKTCYYSQTILMNGHDGKTQLKYNLIPSATQSIKVLLEVPYLVVFFYQHFKTSVQTEALDFMRLGLDFLNVTVSKAPKNSINQTLADDFVCAQSRFLSFVNIMAKIPAFMELIQANGNLLVTGTMQMLDRCPPDLISVRREVLMALKYFTSGDMKTNFFPMLPRLISENVVLGVGFTSIDHLRTFMYQMLADLLHHMRNSIDIDMMTHVTYVFCRNLHDQSNSSHVQIMSARLLNSLAESLTRMDATAATRDLLIEILEAHVAKLKVIAVYHMPILFQQYGSDIDYEYKSYERDNEKPGMNIPKETVRGVPKRRIRKLSIDSVEEFELLPPSTSNGKSSEGKAPLLPPPTKEGTKHNSPEAILSQLAAVAAPPLPLSEARNLVKYIMHTCKFVTGQLRTGRASTDMYHCAKERDLFERLLRYGVMCMDIFVLPTSRNTSQAHQSARTKDEKDTLESLANVFTTIDHAIFRELFEKYMDFLIERIYNRNYPLQLMVNTFLVRNEVPFFASTMLSFLMSRMKLLEIANDKTTLYVKLFKIIFSAIGSATSGLHSDKMLTSYLPEILKQSTVCALTAREPLNYFIVLRSMFRSVGGSAQDMLYGKFLQLLPNLLQFLNKLTSCQHRVQMRELFVELCLTVPVRLSSLLPYLPLLMDPLVCAMYGSSNIVNQGLRTLELCVDNLQPEYLLENMLPVRGALMQGLWRVVSKAPDSYSTTTAFRILGKFGGANRKLLNQPQLLQVVSLADSYVNMEFVRQGVDNQLSLRLPLSELMRVAADQMRYPADMISNPSPTAPPSTHMKKWCMELSKAVILTGLGSSGSSVKVNGGLADLYKKMLAEFDPNNRTTEVYVCQRENDRELYINAILAMAYGIWNKDGFHKFYSKFFVQMLRQFTLIGVLEYIGGNGWIRKAEEEGMIGYCLDSSVVIDALVTCLSETSNSFVYAGVMSLRNICETITVALPDISQMSKVPMCRYMMDKILKLCHGPAWFARSGGITALQYMIENYPRKFIMDFVVEVVDSIMEVILGTVDEISSGSSDLAYDALKKMMQTYFIKDPERSEENLTLAAIFMAVFAKHYFHNSERVQTFMRQLTEICMEESHLEPTIEKFLMRFKEFFEPEILKIVSTAPTMSLIEAISSLAGLHKFCTICPDAFDFEKDLDLYKRYVAFLLDLAQTDTFTINQRPAFKKCETCPSHFLPPYPITTLIDSMRTGALQCLVVVYDRMKKQYEASIRDDEMEIDETEETMIEILALRSSRITIEQVYESKETWRRVMTVLLRTDNDLDIYDISDEVHIALLKVAPIPTNIIATFGASHIRKINRASDENNEDRYIPYQDIAKFKKLVELNPKILGATMAQNLTNQMIRWKMSDKISRVLGIAGEATEHDLEMFEMEKLKGVRELEMIGFIASMIAGCPMSNLNDKMIVDIARFAAHFEYTYSQDVLVNWIDDVATILNKSPVEVWKFFLLKESVHDPARCSLIRRIIVYDQTDALRQVFMDNPDHFDHLLDMDGERETWKDEEERDTWDRDMFALSLVDRISKKCPAWLVSPLSPVSKIQELFKFHEFKARYAVRDEKRNKDDEEELTEIKVKNMTEHKYKVPKLVVNIFLRYLRQNIEDYEMFFDLVTTFIGNYITDFSFVREYLEQEVIPIMPLQWRRQIFIRVMMAFEENPAKAASDLRIVKSLQYLVIPCLQWAFERYDTDEIVGTPPIDDTDSTDADSSGNYNMDNLVGRLASVVEAHRQKLSDGMVIQFYQLCTLFVQHASEHIHNNNCKKQGGRLRVFMLFAWPCLTITNHQDPTMRFTGFFFLSNIIEKFTINRKIVLQVFHALTTTYQQDTRDQIRKAIDIMTPAVKARMEDGHQQILVNVKKVLIEECHTLQHVQHIYQIVTRNYRVYYHVRHDLLSPILNSVQRALLMPNSTVENWLTRRHAIEIAEMIVKWELFGTLKSDHIITDEEAAEVDRQLDKLRTSNSQERLDFEVSKVNMPDSQRTISREHVDIVVNMLARFCMTFHQTANGGSTGISNGGPQANDLIKKSVFLLRACLRVGVWGEICQVRTNMMEKYLSIQPDTVRHEISTQQHAIACHNAQQTLEMVATIIMVMPKQQMLTMLRPLQRPLISCLNAGNLHQFKVARWVTQMIGRLLEKAGNSMQGLEELEVLSNFVVKYLNDQFTQLLKNQIQQAFLILTAFSLLRTICGYEPAYLDQFLTIFLRVMERVAKEHLQGVAAGQDMQMMKNGVEILSVCMELLRSRVDFIPSETKRLVVVNILSELILKSTVDKIVIAVVKLLCAMMTTQDMDFTMHTVLPQLVRVQAIIVARFKNSKELIAEFLVVILKVFENADYRNTESGIRLWEGFFWGLKSTDPQTRENFLVTWEMSWTKESAVDMVERMKYVMRNQDWAKFKHVFWLKFVLWGMLRTISKKPNTSGQKRKKVMMLHCASPWKTIEYAARLKENLPEVETKQEEPDAEPMEEGEKSKEKKELTLEQLLKGQQELLEEAANYDFADALDVVSHMTFGLSDNSVTSRIFMTLFKSLWDSLEKPEAHEFSAYLVPFLSSGSHNYFNSSIQDSVIAVWLETIGDLTILPSRLIEFLAKKHECWYTGIKQLEIASWKIPKQLNNMFLRDMNVGPVLAGDIETLESLDSLYQDINEFDQSMALWERRAVLPETLKAMTAMQLGDMEQAISILETTMSQVYEQVFPNVASNASAAANNQPNNDKHISPIFDKEYDHWMEMYISSCAELNQWQAVADICNSKDMQHVRGLLAASTHIPDWAVVEECKSQIQGCIPPNFYLEYTLYNLMCNVMRMSEHQTILQNKDRCKAALQDCVEAHIQRWRSLPSIVSYGHVKILQSMNLIREIEESLDVRLALAEAPKAADATLMTEMKSLMKVFRNRTGTTGDPMSFVSSWYDWRNQIHGMMLQRFDYWDRVGKFQQNTNGSGNQSIVPIHSMAQAQLTVAKHAKSIGFHNLAKDLLNKLAGLTAIPMMDAQDKVCTYGKTLRDMALSTTDDKLKNELLFEALEVLEDVRIDDLQKDQVATLLYHRANVHSALDQIHNADVTFSSAAQLVDLGMGINSTGIKLMKNWGHHLYKRFFSTNVCKQTGNNSGRQALACYFVAARVDSDIKARKPIAKILWLAKHLSACGSHEALNRVIKKQLPLLNVFNWLFWLPQIVAELRLRPNTNFALILAKIAAAYPLQVLYHIRDGAPMETIDAVLREDYTEEEMSLDIPDDVAFSNDDPFSRSLKICLKYRPTDVRVFHRILKELEEMDEIWVERHLRYAIALKDQLFADFSDQMDAHFNEMNFTRKVQELAKEWMQRLQEDFKYFQDNYNLDFLLIRQKRKMVVTKGYMGDEKSQLIFEKELSQVYSDPIDMEDEMTFVTNATNMIVPLLALNNPDAARPQVFIRSVLHWIKCLRQRFDKLPKRLPLDSSSPFLARFSHRTGCIEMPYDLLNVLRPKNPNLLTTNQTGHYISMLSRFEPNFELHVKSGHVMRKIYLRGQTGKSVAFYLKKSCRPDTTNRVPQLFKHLDHVLQSDHESARRHLSAPMFSQMRVGKCGVLMEIASVQPYAMPNDSTRNYPSSQIDVIHPYDVLTNTFGSYSPDEMVLHFFERFSQSCSSIGQPLPNSSVNEDGTATTLTESHHIKHIIYEDFARDMIPFSFLWDYMCSRYPDPVMYYSMRKQFLHSHAVLSMIEYHFNLTPMGAHHMVIAISTGVLSNPFYRFELNEGRSLADIQQFGHEVPFRLTPNLSILVGVAQDGDLQWSMAAAAKCFLRKEPEIILRPLIWDEYANNVSPGDLVYACHAANSYVNGVTNKLRSTNSPTAELQKDDPGSLISRAKNTDNLSRMPPTYHAWF